MHKYVHLCRLILLSILVSFWIQVHDPTETSVIIVGANAFLHWKPPSFPFPLFS